MAAPHGNHENYPVGKALALGELRRVPRERTGDVWQRDPLGNYLAFGDFHKVCAFLCKKRLRDRHTGALGVALPDMTLRHMYEYDLDDETYEQTFRIIMFGLAPKDQRYDPILTGRDLDRLFRWQMIHWNQLEYNDILMNTIVPEVQAFMSDPACTLRNWAMAMGKPIASETYGDGALLSDLRTTVRRMKGGLFERKVHAGDVG